MEYLSQILKFSKEVYMKWGKYIIQLIVFSVVLFLVAYYLLVSAPRGPEKTVKIESGSSLVQISSELSDEHIIRSSNVFRMIVMAFGRQGSIKAGTYLFKGGDSAFSVARRLVRAEYGIPMEKITITEGMDSREVAKLVSSRIPTIGESVLVNEMVSKEGYLFPDTYFIPLSATSGEVVNMLSSNFDRMIAGVNLESSLTSKKRNDIITMASILEGEARDEKDKKIVSGILWKRIRLGMPLQVDAAFSYINGKASKDLTVQDLAVDSPYNTYLYKGLPPGPINNPGLESIEAAMFPTENPYLYYLSDKDGVMHYAKTFEEHKVNKIKYLNSN